MPTCAGINCNKESTLQCPTCKNNGSTNSYYFCSQDCFKRSWKTHKKQHGKKDSNKETQSQDNGLTSPTLVFTQSDITRLQTATRLDKLVLNKTKREGYIAGVQINCIGDQPGNGLFVPIFVPRNHPIFQVGDLCPVSKKIGITLLSHRVWTTKLQSYMLENRPALAIMMDPISYDLDDRWYGEPGTTLFVREDKECLGANELECLWIFHHRLLETRLEKNGKKLVESKMTPEYWNAFREGYESCNQRFGNYKRAAEKNSKDKKLTFPNAGVLCTSNAIPSAPGEIVGVQIMCKREIPGNGMFKPISVLANHPVFTRGELSPLSVKIGIPLLIHRPNLAVHILRKGGVNNQPATYLMIDPHTGFAPFHWQQDIGTVIVVRKDKKPLAQNQLEGIWRYIGELLSTSGSEEESAHARNKINPSYWKKFWKRFKSVQKPENGRLDDLGWSDTSDTESEIKVH